MPCEVERAAIKTAKRGREKGLALQKYLKCKHVTEAVRESESRCSCK